MWHERVDATVVAAALRRAGVVLPADEVRAERRDERWLVRLPHDRVAWLPASPEGERALQVESRVLRLIRARCSFQVPDVLFSDPESRLELRSFVGAPTDPWRLVAVLQGDAGLGRQLGEQIGRILAEQHELIAEADVAGWLPRTLAWPLAPERVQAGVETVVPERGDLHLAAAEVLARYQGVSPAPEDLVLAHTDVGFHNLALAEDGRRVLGLYDYYTAAWADRHHDFPYLIYDLERVDLIEAALTSYESATGCALSRERILLYNAARAFSYLAFRTGVAADEKWCGRTLAEDVAWCEWAAENVLTGRGARLLG